MHTDFPRTAIIYDIDGVAADSRARSAKHIDYAAEARGDHDAFKESLLRWGETTDGDTPIPQGYGLIAALHYLHKPDALIALTSRGEGGRAATLAWLRANLHGLPVKDEWLRMRPLELEGLPSPEFKVRVLETILQEYHVIFAVDDHPGNCDMYYRRGIPTLHLMLPGVDCLSVPEGALFPPAKEGARHADQHEQP